jgi:hypothetical protein
MDKSEQGNREDVEIQCRREITTAGSLAGKAPVDFNRLPVFSQLRKHENTTFFFVPANPFLGNSFCGGAVIPTSDSGFSLQQLRKMAALVAA